MDYLIEKKQYDSFNYRADFGRASIQVVCPFCNTRVTAYVWSMAGGGKKCPGCGAMHTGFGLTIRKIPAIGTDNNLEVCKREGYLMVEPKGRFKPDKRYRVFAYWPAYTLNGKEATPNDLTIDTHTSWNELKTIYEANRDAILSFSDDMDTLMAVKKPGYNDLVQAASTIQAYRGLP